MSTEIASETRVPPFPKGVTGLCITCGIIVDDNCFEG